MFESDILIAIGLTFLLAGAVKGVIGMGLPTVSLALLTIMVGLPQAMALLLVPSFVTNMWQGVSGGNGRTIVRRLWPFFALATVTVWVGAAALTRVDLNYLSALLGVLLVIYAGVNLVGIKIAVAPSQERWVGPVMGVTNGVLTGMTGSFVVPGVMYLQSIGLPRDMLIQGMGILFTVSTLALAVSLGGNGLLGKDVGLISLAAVIPALLGMELGKRVRQIMSEVTFRRAFFIATLVIGCFIVVRNVL